MIKAVAALAITLNFASASAALAADTSEPVSSKMDKATDGVVITKLESVLNSMDKDDPTRTRLVLRLADLYSERARLEGMEEAEKNCTDCKEAAQDRTRALELYQSVADKAGKEELGSVIVQMAQLHELQGHADEANKLYKKIAAQPKKYAPELVGRAHARLGEMYFNQMKYDDAEKELNKALAIKTTPRRGYIMYRLAWCYFHKEQQARAVTKLTEVLSNPELRGDNSFQEEATRDLATFMSRMNVGPDEIQKLSRLSPDATRKENLTYLAGELDRLGRKASAVQVWAAIGNSEKQKTPAEKIDSHLRLAELQYDVGRKDMALAEFQVALSEWKQNGCESGDECVTLRQRMRKLVLDWSQAEKDKPSENLMKAFESYTAIFPDMEMNYRAAQEARLLSRWNVAINYYRNASTLAASSLKKGGLSTEDNKLFTRDFEAALLGEIEVAEITKDIKLRRDAYNNYLALNPSGAKSEEVQYQKAHLLYEEGKYLESANAFKEFALAKGPGDLRVKAADLALDALVLAKEAALIDAWAVEFANRFPQRRADFLKISRKGILNQVATILNNPQAQKTDYEQANAKLTRFNMNGANVSEKITYYKDKLIISEKLENLSDATAAANGLLAVKGLPQADREFALSRKAWVAELMLDFKTAFALTKRLKLESLTREAKLLKLGLLAELSGNNPDGYYRDYLEIAKDNKMAAVIAAKLVRGSKQPAATLHKYRATLVHNPELYANLALEAFARTRDYHVADDVLKNDQCRETAGGHTLARIVFLRDFQFINQMVAQHKLSVASQNQVKQSLKARLKLLEKLEGMTDRALKSEDWVLQIVTLNAYADQNRRLAAEISGLPAPRGLNRAQRVEYKGLLSQQASKYQAKAQETSKKISDLWYASNMTITLFDDYQKAKGPIRKILGEELRWLAKAAPVEKRKSFTHAIASTEVHGPTAKSIEEARNAVRGNPFSPKELEKLKSLEERAGSDTFAAYLDARLLKLGEKK